MDPKDRKGVIRRIGIMLFLGMAALVGIKWIQSRERLLTNVARPLTKMDVNKEQISWLSDHELLFVTTIKDEAESKDPKGVPVHQNRQGSVDVLNTTTHTRAHLTGLTDLMNITQAFPTREQDSFTLSPDHDWILWDIYQRNRDSLWTNVSRLDGTHARKWTVLPGEKLFLDSRHFASMVNAENARAGHYPFILFIRDLQDPNGDKTVMEPEQVKAAIAPIAAQEDIRVKENLRASVGEESSVAIETYRLLNLLKGIPVQQRLVTLPAGAELKNAFVSPQHQLILYHLIISHTSPTLTWLHHLIPGFAITPTRSAELWVSRADGQRMHEIGHEPYTMLSQISLKDRLEEIEWLPNGKQVSFTYQGKLYVVSAEPSP